MSLSKKLFIVSSSLLALVLIFWGVYNLAFKPKTAPAAVQEKSKSATETPLPAPEKKSDSAIIAISDDPVIAPILDERGKGIKYYSQTTGRAYHINLDGQNKKSLLDQNLLGLLDVVWSPDESKVISKTTQQGKTRFYYYDYTQAKEIPLKENLDTVVWQNDKRILYKYYEPASKKRSLSVSDFDGTNWKDLADISYRRVSIAPVPRTGLVSFWNEPDALAETIFQTIPAIGGEIKTLLKGKFGVDYSWSPDGSNILVSHSNERAGNKMQLAIINAQGGEYRSLDIPTFISKCVWSQDGKTVYYALPGNIPNTAILPNEYGEKKFNTADTFWKVEIVSSKKTRLVELDKIGGNFDASNLFLNKEESLLFFVNRIDNRLYQISL